MEGTPVAHWYFQYLLPNQGKHSTAEESWKKNYIETDEAVFFVLIYRFYTHF